MTFSPSSLVKLPDTDVFGKYRLIAKLGQGGMADVFLAISRGPGGFAKLVVIKRLKGFTTEEALHGIFEDEAKIAARLNHPNVVQTTEVGTIEEQFYLCMEHLEGQSLDHVLARLAKLEKKAIGEALRVLCDALIGLQYAHDLADYDGSPLNLVHRDVSPQNIFVTYEGTTKVLDFGIAKATVSSSHTSTGVVKGKLTYMAPEQALSVPVDRRADVFSVGVMLFELLSGERLWRNLTEIQIIKRLAFGDVPRLADRKLDLPPALVSICDRALAAAPADRYPTAAALRGALETATKDAGLARSTEDVGRLVLELFRARREELRELVQQSIAGGPVSASIPDQAAIARAEAVTNIITLGAEEPATRVDRPASNDDKPRSDTAIVSTGDATPPAPQPRSRVGIAVLAVLLGLSAATAFALRHTPQKTPVAPAVSASTELPGLLELRVGATPSDAVIYLDDATISGNPFIAKFAADHRAHTLRVEATGYKTESRLVVLDHDLSIDMHLEKAAPSDVAATSVAPAASGPRPPLHGPTRQPVKVDSSDPWR